MVYNADSRVVSFSNSHFENFEVEVGSKLKGPLYFYLEMKTKGTSVQFLQ